MPVFFKKITDDQFNLETGFVVKESKRMHLIIGILLLIFAVIFFQGFVNQQDRLLLLRQQAHKLEEFCFHGIHRRSAGLVEQVFGPFG